MRLLLFVAIWILSECLSAQTLFRGADLSYVNEMEDCGVLYKNGNSQVDPFQFFGNSGCNLVRLRLWHNPTWYKSLNQGKMYSNYEDVKKSIKRAKTANMKVLLDFHLSDTWADPSNQLVPKAWEAVVNNLPALKDSLYQYIYSTLDALAQENLLPYMVQIGNETNRGILLSAQDNAKWTLVWPRNATLFNAAINAVKDVEKKVQQRCPACPPSCGPQRGRVACRSILQQWSARL